MLTQFLPNTCNISQVIKTTHGGEEIKTENPIYTGISCYYYQANQVLDETDLAENTNLSNYRVIIEPNKTLVREEMYITIFDSDLGTIGKFIIQGVKINRLLSGYNDSIQLEIKKI